MHNLCCFHKPLHNIIHFEHQGMSAVILAWGDSASANTQPPRALRQRLLAVGALAVQAMVESSPAKWGR